jgi:hypothetical protein
LYSLLNTKLITIPTVAETKDIIAIRNNITYFVSSGWYIAGESKVKDTIVVNIKNNIVMGIRFINLSFIINISI